jgi:hypothetical protein
MYLAGILVKTDILNGVNPETALSEFALSTFSVQKKEHKYQPIQLIVTPGHDCVLHPEISDLWMGINCVGLNEFPERVKRKAFI